MVPKNEFLPLNDKDVISIGGNYSLIEASGDKRIFLYEINAPHNCDSDATSVENSEKFVSKTQGSKNSIICRQRRKIKTLRRRCYCCRKFRKNVVGTIF